MTLSSTTSATPSSALSGVTNHHRQISSSSASSSRHRPVLNEQNFINTQPNPASPLDEGDSETPPVPTPTSSSSTITPSTFTEAQDGPPSTTTSSVATPTGTEARLADSEAASQAEDDEDPTIRVYQGDPEGSRPSVLHSQRSSFSSFSTPESDGEDPRFGRDESPAASLRYVNGTWDRAHRRPSDNIIGANDDSSDEETDDREEDGDADYDHPETEDEVVYRGRGRGLGPALVQQQPTSASNSTPILNSTSMSRIRHP